MVFRQAKGDRLPDSLFNSARRPLPLLRLCISSVSIYLVNRFAYFTNCERVEDLDVAIAGSPGHGGQHGLAIPGAC